jgi:tetratricopeptide (TPR) repeat protein
MRDDIQSYLDLAVEYGNGGFYLEALELLEDAAHLSAGDDDGHPMVYYYFAHYAEALGDAEAASRARQLAPTMPSDYCFPHRWEAEPALRQALDREPTDARAPYYLGNLLYDHQPEAAIAAWEMARKPRSAFCSRASEPGTGLCRSAGRSAPAIASLEQAVALSRPTPASSTNWTCSAKPRRRTRHAPRPPRTTRGNRPHPRRRPHPPDHPAHRARRARPRPGSAPRPPVP